MPRRTDTTPDAEARRLAILRALPPERRLEIAAEMSDEVKTIARAGIRARHPTLAAAAVDEELARMLCRPRGGTHRPGRTAPR